MADELRCFTAAYIYYDECDTPRRRRKKRLRAGEGVGGEPSSLNDAIYALLPFNVASLTMRAMFMALFQCVFISSISSSSTSYK